MRTLAQLRAQFPDEDLEAAKAAEKAWVRHVEDSPVEVELLPAPTTLEEDLTNALALLERVDTLFENIEEKAARQLLDAFMYKELVTLSNEIMCFLEDWIRKD